MLKDKAKSSGGFVEVNISDVYSLFESLFYFFHGKHHEWVAICFLNENFTTTHIWFNKGPDRNKVTHHLTPEEILKYARNFNSKYIITHHNHIASSKQIPNYESNTKRRNISAHKNLSEEIFGFSDQDINSLNYYSNFFDDYDIKVATGVHVTEIGHKILSPIGEQEIVKNYERYRDFYKRKMKDNSNSSGCLAINTLILIFLLSYWALA